MPLLMEALCFQAVREREYMQACVIMCYRTHDVLQNCLWKFYQVYNLGAGGDKDSSNCWLLVFWLLIIDIYFPTRVVCPSSLCFGGESAFRITQLNNCNYGTCDLWLRAVEVFLPAI